ncbi:MAG: glycosyltransferase family 4 protein [Prolixibacteraceae bacterium]|nr:glycosyltransferase family 4 protein [Prolixibacteraceae bacterium]MBN2648936.1 glycosyltransferase family 4 protein [Prolixibacteraceae bacterium]
MRIVIIADSVDLQNAGIHVYTRSMIEALQTYTSHEIICIRQGKRQDIHFENDVTVKPALWLLEKDPLRVFWSMPRAIKKLKPDCVIEPAHFGPFNLPPHIKRVTIIHDLTPLAFPQWHHTFSSTLQKWFLPFILKKASMVVPNSKNTLNDLHQYFPQIRSKSEWVYPGINPYYRIPEDGLLVEKQPYFLSVGTIEPRKNLVCLLKAYALFRKNSQHNHRLILVGPKGWKSDKFYQQLEEHPYRNDIEIKGYVSQNELRDLYGKASAFIYPSFYEGFGFPVAEAMACGAPCIVSSSSSLPEVGGDAVLYFNPESPDELSQKMQQLVNDKTLCKTLIEKGYRQAQKFSWTEFASSFDTKVLQNIKKDK